MPADVRSLNYPSKMMVVVKTKYRLELHFVNNMITEILTDKSRYASWNLFDYFRWFNRWRLQRFGCAFSPPNEMQWTHWRMGLKKNNRKDKSTEKEIYKKTQEQ